MGGMDDDSSEGDLTIEELIELELLSAQIVIEVVEEVDELSVQARDSLSLLLDQLRRGEVPAEYAEVQLERIRELRSQWLRDNPIPPD